MAFVNDRSEMPYKTIDRSRDLTLFFISGIPKTPGKLFEFHVGNEIVKFGAYYEMQPTKENMANVTYKIFQVSIPKNFSLSKMELRELITEALKVYGFSYQTNDIENVFVEVAPNLANI